MAEKQITTPGTHERNTKLAASYMGLEAAVCDARSALNVYEHLREDFFEGPEENFLVKQIRKRNPEMKDLKIFVMTATEMDAFTYAGNHLAERIQNISDQYHDGFEEAEDAPG